MIRLDRRSAVLAGVGAGASPLFLARALESAPALLRAGPAPGPAPASAARSGDVTTDSATLWARAERPGRLHLRLTSNGRRIRSVRGQWATPDTDHTARLTLDGLAPGREYDATLWFDAGWGPGRTERLTFRTAPIHPAATSFVWSGDTCGQGYGINPDLGGLTGYAAMLAVRPDLFIHCGDNIYGDEPMAERMLDPEGNLWRNEVTDAVSRVAETLDDFRGRYAYLLSDVNVAAFHAEVPTVAQWDDHETLNNWYPGELHDDDRYTERRCDVLAARGRRAWQEYQPIPLRQLSNRGTDGFAARRIYRKVPRGAHLDVFCLDMRSHRSANGSGLAGDTGILGEEQADWLIREVAASRATWKVISADMPLSVATRHADDRDSIANDDDGRPRGREKELARVLAAFKEKGVRNVVWITADVHYTAAHHYSPDRAVFTDFDPFWEFVSGPIAAGTFPVKRPDATFGPQVLFAKGGTTIEGQSPAGGNQFFGQALIAADGTMTVNLRDIGGDVLWSRALEPA